MLVFKLSHFYLLLGFFIVTFQFRYFVPHKDFTLLQLSRSDCLMAEREHVLLVALVLANGWGRKAAVRRLLSLPFTLLKGRVRLGFNDMLRDRLVRVEAMLIWILLEFFDLHVKGDRWRFLLGPLCLQSQRHVVL
jgi:hypothetical protein